MRQLNNKSKPSTSQNESSGDNLSKNSNQSLNIDDILEIKPTKRSTSQLLGPKK